MALGEDTASSQHGLTAHADVPALRKGLAVLDLLAARGPMTMKELQLASGLKRTMTYRVLRALSETGYVTHDLVQRHYSLGLRLLQLGAVVVERLDVAAIARPLLAELREETRETVNLGVLDGNETVYVVMMESPLGLRMAARLGGREPAHSTSLGKAVLAFLLPAERDEIVKSLLPLRAMTAATLVDTAALARNLTLTRERGYAFDDEESEVGVRCVGVPVLDGVGRPLAGMSVSGPVGRIDLARAERLAAQLWEASREISRRVGHVSCTDHRHAIGEGRDDDCTS